MKCWKFLRCRCISCCHVKWISYLTISQSHNIESPSWRLSDLYLLKKPVFFRNIEKVKTGVHHKDDYCTKSEAAFETDGSFQSYRTWKMCFCILVKKKDLGDFKKHELHLNRGFLLKQNFFFLYQLVVCIIMALEDVFIPLGGKTWANTTLPYFITCM